jgi:hypothetical protein
VTYIGKSHLSASIVEKSKLNRTIFAFVSYSDSSTLTAISILHSLILQLVGDDLDLQLKLCDSFRSSRRDLKSNLRYVREALSELLKCTGQTYMVIDGLDETSELERQRALDELLAIIKDNDEIKLLISSRNEDDLARILKDDAVVIRVDHRNSGCVQAYLTSRTQRWFDKSQFEADACSEIRALLAPLAANADGKHIPLRKSNKS